jgi:hypothetical protein
MASEDSDQVLPGFSMVHGLSYFCDFDQSSGGQMSAVLTEFDAPGELLEIFLLRRAKRIRSEERDDHPEEIFPPAHDVAMQMLLVVVVPPIDADGTDPKETLQVVQGSNAFGTLNHYKAMSHLISGFVASSVSPIWLSDKTN